MCPSKLLSVSDVCIAVDRGDVRSVRGQCRHAIGLTAAAAAAAGIISISTSHGGALRRLLLCIKKQKT